jgi:hypothetical protein
MSRVRNQDATARRTRTGEVRDLLLYVLVGVGAVTGVSLVAVFTKVDFNSLFKWLGFGVVTALVFGDTIRTSLHHWRRRRFWVLLGIFFAVQCGLSIPLLWTVTKVPAIYWGLFFPLDYGALAAYLAYFLDLRRD